MKYLFFVGFIINMSFSQKNNDSFFIFKYISNSSISVSKNTKSSFTNDTISVNKGFSIELNSLHGLLITKRLAVSVGLGLDWNIDKTFITNTFLVDIRYYFNRYGESSPYIFLQKGFNINWNDTFSKGQSAKLGFGYTFDFNENALFFVEIFKKVKENKFADNKYFYNVDSFGLGFGVKF